MTKNRLHAHRQKGPPDQPDERTLREEHLLDAAAAGLVRWGYRKTTMDDVASVAGVGKGTIYLHWKTKDDLFRAAICRAHRQVSEDLQQRIATHPEGGLPHRLWVHGIRAALDNPLMVVKAEPLQQLAAEFPGVQILALDATEEDAPARVFETLAPDVLVMCAGAIPHMAPLVEQNWEQFSRNWKSDVKLSLLFAQAALTTPLPSGATVILMPSGAALGDSPLSGGDAGTKRMQMFLANYAQKESDRLHLGLWFLALVSGGMIPETDLGKVVVECASDPQGRAGNVVCRG